MAGASSQQRRSIAIAGAPVLNRRWHAYVICKRPTASTPRCSQAQQPQPAVPAANFATAAECRTAPGAGRLPSVLTATFPAKFQSLSSARKACRKRLILVDDTTGKCDTEVAAGQLLQILKSPLEVAARQQRRQAQAAAQAAQHLHIAYLDDHLAVVVKPFGLHVYGRGVGHLKHWLHCAVPISNAAGALPAACPVHRLDALTGGLLVCARTRAAARGMTEAFEQRKVCKQYTALVAGHLQSSHQLNVIDTHVGGKPAITHWTVTNVTRSLKFDWVSTVNLWPLTGRKHQLRVHMAGIQHPILGDSLYHIPRQQEQRQQQQEEEQEQQQQPASAARHLSGSRGLCLWSQRVIFEHPVAPGQLVDVSTAEPDRFEHIRQQELQRYWKFNGHAIEVQRPEDVPPRCDYVCIRSAL